MQISFEQRSSCLDARHQGHHQGPPGHSHHWHQAHTESAQNLDLDGAEPFFCNVKRKTILQLTICTYSFENLLNVRTYNIIEEILTSLC